MWNLFRCVIAGSLGLFLAPAPPAQAQALPGLFKGKWVFEGTDCRAGLTLQLAGDVLRLTDATGHADTQRVTSRRATGIATKTTASTHGQPVGKAWVYEFLGPGQISLTEGRTGRSANLIRCPDPLPANITPRQLLETIYARYAASDEPNLPLSSEANLHAFLVPDLADKVIAFVARSGRLPDDCKPDDPFVPGFSGDYKVTEVRVDLDPVADGADHATGRVSFRNFGKPATVSVTLDQTAAGWRIADVSPAPGQSFRANMTLCLAPAPG